MSNPTSTALVQRDDSPKALVKQYEQSFMDVLPSHVKPETWVRLAQGALKKGKKVQGGRTELEVAASNNPGVFLASLLDAARLGLEPGTEQYYLTPRKVKGQLEILGIVGYQGHIELMYRAGAISSVVAECVYSNDVFRFSPGADEIPVHEIDWDADDRGHLRLVYAFARMKDGATSKVVVLNQTAINRIMESSPGSSYDSSPWQKHPDAMWLKSAVRQLTKWVPTSSEYRDQVAQAPAGPELRLPASMTAPDLGPIEDLPDVPGDDDFEDHGTDDDIIEAEIVDDEPAPPPPPPAPRPVPDPPIADDVEDPDQMTEPQRKALHALLRKRGGVGDTRFPILSDLLGREITSTNELSKADASFLIDAMQADEGGAPEGDAA
jgi:recombination protein RecT